MTELLCALPIPIKNMCIHGFADVQVNGESVFRYFYIDIRYIMMVAYGAVQVHPLILD